MSVKQKKLAKAPKTRGTNTLNLETVLELGGSKDDLELLQDVDDDEEVFDGLENDLDAEPVKRDELKDFIAKLDIKKYRPVEENVGKKKKKKLLEASTGDTDEIPKTKGLSPPTPQPKTRKGKNKYKVQDDEVSSTCVVSETTDVTGHIRAYQPRKYLLVKPGGNWFDSDTMPDHSATPEDLTESVIQQMDNFAAKLLQDEISLYNRQKESGSKSQVGWIKTVLSSGTLADKMAALTLLVQESPVHNLTSLDSLVAMAKKKGKRECMLACDSLKDLFLSNLLPDKRKLRTFHQHPLSSLGQLTSGNKEAFDRRLMLWYYEGQLKEKYSSFIQALQTMSHDTILATKQKAVGAIFHLLANKPEQEKALLTMLVNKVGDPNYKLASKASHLLSKLVDQHPNMKYVIVEEVERLMYRPNIPVRAQYYSICFLNQLMLTAEEKTLAARLIKVYFSFFKVFVKKGEVDSKMMSALLSGVNRSYPYAKVDSEFIGEQMDTLYKIVHIVNFNTSLQALMLLHQVLDSSQSVSDRYYSALYRKMVDPTLKNSAKQSMFLNLLFKSMKKDVSERRVKAFIKRLLQICSHQSAPFICGSLVLLSEVLQAKPGVLSLTHMEEDSDDEEHFVDLPDPDSETESKSGEDRKDGGKTIESTDASPPKRSSWVHRKNIGDKSDSGQYDPCHRNPLYCHADHECVWELKKLVQHFHPSVSLFAKNILKGVSISYNSDPLQDFTLIRFLDRFVYKNPKKHDHTQHGATLSKTKARIYYPKGVKKLPINSEKYLKRAEEEIPVEEKFFHRYFTQKAARERREEEELSDYDSEAGSVDDNEFDDFLDSYEKQFDDAGDGFGDMSFDFAGEFEKPKKGKKKKKKGESDEDEDGDDLSDEEDEDGDGLSDEEVDFGDDEDFAAAFAGGDSDGSDVEDKMDEAFSDDDELGELDPGKRKGEKRKAKAAGYQDDDYEMSPRGKKAKRNESASDLFVAAEEFAHLIDANMGSKVNMTGLHALSNKDNAGLKQLNWEMERDRAMQGQDWRSKKSAKKTGKFNSNKGKSKFSKKGKQTGKQKSKISSGPKKVKQKKKK